LYLTKKRNLFLATWLEWILLLVRTHARRHPRHSSTVVNCIVIDALVWSMPHQRCMQH